MLGYANKHLLSFIHFLAPRMAMRKYGKCVMDGRRKPPVYGDPKWESIEVILYEYWNKENKEKVKNENRKMCSYKEQSTHSAMSEPEKKCTAENSCDQLQSLYIHLIVPAHESSITTVSVWQMVVENGGWRWYLFGFTKF